MMRNILASKKIGVFVILLVGLLVGATNVFGQTDGDYQTRANGDWNANTTWQVRTGGTWVNCNTGDYPGATASAGIVSILNTDNVTLNVSPTYSIGALTLQTGNRASYITFSGSSSLTVRGITTIEVPTSTNTGRYKYIRVLAGSFTTAGIVMNASGDDGRDSYIEISTGSLTVGGNITMNGNSSRNYILFSGAGTLNIGG